MIQLLQLSKRYGSFEAIAGFTLDVKPGSLVGLLGPNGAGKTTLIRCLTGILLPTSGKVLIDGRDVHRDYKTKRLIGYVPDRPAVYEMLTGEEFMRHVAALYGCHGPETDAKISELFETFLLNDWRHERLSSYSHGMRQKVLLMSGFVHSPKVFVVDEPMVGLDVHARLLLKKMLREFADAGGTVLMTTHTIADAEELCDRLIIVSRGKVVADGSVEEVRRIAGVQGHESLESVFLSVTRDQQHNGDERLLSKAEGIVNE